MSNTQDNLTGLSDQALHAPGSICQARACVLALLGAPASATNARSTQDLRRKHWWSTVSSAPPAAISDEALDAR